MNKWYLAIIVAICVAVAAGFCSSAHAAKLDVVANLSSVQGKVEYQKGGEGGWKTAGNGDLLKEGDMVRTGAGGSCVLSWMNGNVLKLTPFTNLKIEKFDLDYRTKVKNSELSMWSGRAFAKVDKMDSPSSAFTIKTPTAMAGVRGTRMGVGVEADDSTTVECFDGTCVVRGKAGGEVVLKGGKKTSVKKNEPPQTPRDIEKRDIEKFEAAAAEISAVTLDIIQPAGSLETTASSVTVKGATEPGNTVTVESAQSGASVSVAADASGNFSAAVDLAEGGNSIKVTAESQAGKKKSRTVQVKYVKASAAEGPINLTISTPREGLATKESVVTVSGSVSSGTDVSINGIPTGKPRDATTYSGAANLYIEGENRISVMAARSGGNGVEKTVAVIRDTTPAPLTVTQPQANFYVDGGICVREGDSIRCAVAGRTEADAALTINNVRYSVDTDGSFNHGVTLGSGENTIVLIARDPIGNQPATVILTRIAKEVSAVEVSVNPAQLVADSESAATITVTARDFLGNPVGGAAVTLSATGGGALSSSTLITSADGAAAATFTAGVGGIPNTVTITAATGGISASTTLLLTPDSPPDFVK